MSEATDYIQLTHAASEIDGTIDEVYAARGSYGNLSLKIASKQDELSQSQLDAVNSGITAEKMTADEAALAEVVDAGAKNIVHTQDITRKGKGYTATPNGDGTYTVTGSRTENGSAWLEVADVSAEAGSYMLSGGAVGIPVAISAGGSVVYAGINAQEINAEISNKLYIHIMSEFNQSNINYVIKPMICTAADWAISQKFVPYCPSMAEMYAMILAMQNGTRSAPSLAKAEPEETEPETGEEETR